MLVTWPPSLMQVHPPAGLLVQRNPPGPINDSCPGGPVPTTVVVLPPGVRVVGEQIPTGRDSLVVEKAEKPRSIGSSGFGMWRRSSTVVLLPRGVTVVGEQIPSERDVLVGVGGLKSGERGIMGALTEKRALLSIASEEEKENEERLVGSERDRRSRRLHDLGMVC